MTVFERTPVVVLAGGASRRMGSDKRLVPVDGSSMLRQVIDRVAGHPVLVVVDPHRGAPWFLSPADVRVVPDLRPGEGPLAALEAGLAATDADDIVLVVAGDMPWLNQAIMELLIQRLAAIPEAILACLVVDGRRQPFPMACCRSPILALVTERLDAGERRIGSILDGTRVVAIAETEWRRLDPTGRSLRDIDTPADLAASR